MTAKKSHILLLSISLFLFSHANFAQQIEDTVKVHKLEMNTSLSEISADFSGKELYFYRNKRFYQRLSPYYDLHKILKIDANQGKSQKNATSLSDNIKGTSHYHEGPAFIDEKNNKIYLTLNAYNKEDYKEKKKEDGLENNRLRIVEADFKGGQIINLKEFPFNDPNYSMGHATYSHVTKRLYFASNRRGGKGKSDLYYSQKLKDGSWLEPVNLGRRINTPGNEVFPYVKDTILFFSSDNQKGNNDKDLDIYFVSEFDILIAEAEKMPIGINSDDDDFGICFVDSADKYIGYFTSNRKNVFPQNDDIYRFKMNKIKGKRKYTHVVEFVNQFSEGIDSLKVLLKDDKGNVIAESFTDKDGKVSFFGLTKGINYTAHIGEDSTATSFKLNKNLTLDYVEETIEVPQDDAIGGLPDDIGVFSFEQKPDTVDNEDMTIVRNEKERTIDIRLKNIHFALNSAEIFPYSARKLDFIVEYFNAIDAKYIYLEAHTDCRASDAYNLDLSERRALSCRKYLVSKGVPDSKLRHKGMGETQLLNKCDDGVPCPDEMHLENRRVEFKMGY